MLGAGALGRPRGMVRGGRREEGSGWETCVYLWRMHVDIWQNQYNIVKLKNKINRQQPTRLPLPWDSPGKNTEVGCRFLLQCMKVKMKVKSLSRVLLLVTPWTAAHQAPLSMGLSRQEYWSGCHCLLREKLRDLGNLSYSSERTSKVSLLFPVWTWGIKHTALGVVSRP